MKEYLKKYAGIIGVDIDDKKAEMFERYKDILIEKNKVMNLTAITEEKDIVIKHFIDSVIPLCYRDFSGKDVIDIGTGAGFPGMPIKIVCEKVNMTLVDSLRKRIDFLNEAAEYIGIGDIKTFHIRAEDAGKDKQFREKYDYCVSRAVASLNILSEYCLPLIKIGGEFIALKGPEAENEIKEAEKAIEVLGGGIEEIKYTDIYGTDIKHNIVFIKKVKECPEKYPRRANKIGKF
ncbi:MAG: 16S rRNA (guanine(527)-N(7))-methyltransferase RsmG [Firmicutes bacterium]|nr:16S rRNA (guanine(527)-N(7))-methyltransferase RsmG [Bacillota bacterium]